MSKEMAGVHTKGALDNILKISKYACVMGVTLTEEIKAKYLRVAEEYPMML